MPRATIFLPLIICFAFPLLSQSAADKLPTVTTGGNLNPEVVSDINAQLIWLLAASPTVKDSLDEAAARSLYLRDAFGGSSAANQEKLVAALREFRARHDAIASEYNALTPSVARENVWMEYRDFRVKVNDLVAETVRNFYSMFPDSASQFHTAIEQTKRTIYLSSYKSSADPDYANSPRAAATGFTYIQGAVTGNAVVKHSTTTYVTAVIAGMVPGCPGKVFPTIASGGGLAQGPHLHPREYMDFQSTRATKSDKADYGIAVQCAIGER
jgi:hypothetical protein